MQWKSIQAQFTTVVVLVISCVFFGFGYFNYQSSKHERLRGVEQQIEKLGQRLSGSLANPLWELDFAAVRQLVDNEVDESFLLGIAVSSDDAFVYGALSNHQPIANAAAAPLAEQVRVLDIQYAQASSRQKVGTLTLYLSFKPVQQSLQQDLLMTLLEFAALSVATVLAIVWALRRVVIRPIREMGVALSGIASGEADLSMRLGNSRTAEFAELTQSFNRFVEKLQGVMGGSIDNVQRAITRVARGELDADLQAQGYSENSIMGRLAVMQASLRAYHANEKKNAEELMLARDAAEAASLAKGDFLANMSHEIRTPMNAIIGLAGLALKHEMPPRIHDYLGKIQHSGEHLLRIINDVLDFSKIESGKLEVETIAFTLDAVIDNVVTMLSEKIEGKGLELLCRVDAAVPRNLVGDPLRIGQILINMANNAVKFTQQGEVILSVSVKQTLATEVLLEFQVKDTGIGLSAEQAGRLFRSFEQADSSITRQYGGTGLGLAISKSLAQAMGGEVGVHSVQGQGSTFWFTARVGVGSREVMAALPSIDLHGRTVLVVDDNQASAMLLCEMLRELGFDAHEAASGKAALDLLQQADGKGRPYAFVLMDWYMPEMDGLQTVQAIRERKLLSAPCVLMVTAHKRQELVKGAQALGIEHVLAKPVSSSLLVNTMMQIMGRTPSAQRPEPKVLTQGKYEAQLSRLAGARILLVEDNDINQQVACELLRQFHFDVDVADNGQIAVHQVQARVAEGKPYDLVLMDMQMPVMDGVSATRLIRETHSSAQLPIVAMTANAMQADRERCVDAGMDGFVTKPIDPEELWRTILEILPGKQIARPQPVPTAPPVRTEGSEGQASPASVIDALRDVATLDVDLGLVRTSHNPALYARLLRKFVAAQDDAAARIAVLLQSGDAASAERMAHTLKAVAANLGATALQSSAGQLEAALRGGQGGDELDRALGATTRNLQLLIAQLKATTALFAAEPAGAATLGGQKQQVHELVSQLRTLLGNDDAQAVELWEANASLLRAALANAAQVEAAITAYTFEAALVLLDQSHHLDMGAMLQPSQ